jgi:hypothetical protein
VQHLITGQSHNKQGRLAYFDYTPLFITKEERKTDSSYYTGREEDEKANQQNQFKIQIAKFEIKI